MEIFKPQFIDETLVKSKLLGMNVDVANYYDGSIESLLVLYKNDKKIYLDIIDEMILRGYFFSNLKKNSQIKNFETDPTVLIKVTSNKDRYKKIDYFLLGLSGFPTRFKVTNDYFFDSIPLSNFIYLNPQIDMVSLKKEFERVGFDFRKSQTDTGKVTEENLLLEIGVASCEEYFSENKFNQFRRFCRINELKLISEITDEHIDLFKKQKNVGPLRVSDVLLQLQKNNVIINKGESEDKKLVTNYYYSQQLIEYVDSFREDALFMKYCAKLEVKTLGELTNLNVSNYKNCKGVGQTRYNKILEAIKEISSQDYDPIFRLKYFYSDFVESMTIENIATLLGLKGIPENMKQTLLSELIDVDISESTNSLFIVSLQNELNTIDTPFNMVNFFWESLGEEDQDILNQRFSLKRTLQEVGNKYGVSRERIRQKESKILKKLERSLKTEKFKLAMYFYFNSQTVSTENLKNHLTNDLFNYLADKTLNAFKINKLHLYHFSTRVEFIKSKLQDYVDSLPIILTKAEAEESYSDFFEAVELNEKFYYPYTCFFLDEGYRDYEEYYCIGMLSRKDIYKMIIEKDFKGYIEVNEDAIEKIQQISVDRFNVALDNLTIRNFESRALDIDYIVQIDSHIFSLHDPQKVSSEMISQWRNFIQNELLEKKEIVNFDVVFAHFKNSLADIEVYTKLHFYSLIKIYFSEDFTIGRGNTLGITSKDTTMISLPAQLTNIILKNQGSMRRLKLLQEGWKTYQLDQVVQRSDELLNWGEDIIHISTLQVTQVEIAEVAKVINECLVEGYSSVDKIKRKLLLNAETTLIIRKITCLKTSRHWNIFIRYCCPQVKGGFDYLFIENSGLESFTNLVVSKFGDEIYRSQVIALVKELSISENNVETAIKRLRESDDYIEISYNVFKRYEKMEITEFQEAEIRRFFSEVSNKQDGLIMVNHIVNQEIPLPEVLAKWGLVLIHSIGKRLGYIVPEKIVSDYRYDMLLLAEKASGLETFTKFVDYYVKSQDVQIIHEIELYKMLQDKGIIRKRNYEYDMIIPTEFKSESEYFEYDVVTKYFRLKE